MYSNRMWWKLPFFALLGTSVLPGWNEIALPNVWPLAHHRSIGAYRPGVEPQWDTAARRLPPLPVSHNNSIGRFHVWFNWVVLENMKSSTWLFTIWPCRSSPFVKRWQKGRRKQNWCTVAATRALWLVFFSFPQLEVIRTDRTWFSYPTTANASSL